jgi:hypothetical protein
MPRKKTAEPQNQTQAPIVDVSARATVEERSTQKPSTKFSLRKLLGYGLAAAATAPVWLPAAFVGYATYRAARWAFKHPNTTVAGLALAGVIMYTTCDPARMTQTKEATAHAVNWTTERVAQVRRGDLEEKLQEEQQRATTERSQRLETERAYSQVQDRASTLERQISAYRKDQASYEQQLHEAKAAVEAIDAERRRVAEQARIAIAAREELLQSSREQLEAARRGKVEHPRLEALEAPGFYFYYVKKTDSLRSIARYTTGDPDNAALIAQDNALADKPLPGQLVKIRTTITLENVEDLYPRVPKLPSVTIPASMTLVEYFGHTPKLSEALAINERLGVPYGALERMNTARVVWYR